MKARFAQRFVVIVLVLSSLAPWLMSAPVVRAATTWIVQSAVDDGTVNAANCPGAGCRLRDAIEAAASGDTITFAGDMTITLVTSQLSISKNLTIDGSGHSVTISGDTDGDGTGNVRVFTTNATLNLYNLTVTKGYAGFGGGIYSSGTLNVANVSFVSNTANGGFGGAIYVYSGAATIANSTFAANYASFGGGVTINTGTLVINNSTFASNTAGSVSGILANGGTTTVRNTILFREDSMRICLRQNTGTVLTIINSQANDTYCNSYGGSYSASILLGDLGNYGGLTPTVPLLPGSSAIDAGDDAVCAALPGGNVDQRGESRIGTHCDIGAFESHQFALAYGSGDGQSTPINLAFPNPLVVNVTANDAREPVDGGRITYTGPSSGASTNPAAYAATITSGAASPTLTANGTADEATPYTVIASANGASGSPTFLLMNLKGNTTTTLDSSQNPSEYGQSVTLTATVTSPSGTPASGTVDFRDGKKIIDGCDSQPLSGGQATCTTSALSAGSHNIRAEYSGDSSYNSSTSDTLTQVVNCALAITVTNANATGAGSLHQAIADACAGGTITFDGDHTVALTAGNLTIDKDLTIDGAGHKVVISGDGEMNIMYVYGDVTFNLQNLTLTNGYTALINDSPATTHILNSTITDNYSGNGGALYNTGTMTIQNSAITNNQAVQQGGGIFNDSASDACTATPSLTLINSTLSGNTAGTSGGGIYNNNGVIEIDSSTITANTAPDNMGGGVMSYNDDNTCARIGDSIIAGNAGSDVGSEASPTQRYYSLDYNLIGAAGSDVEFDQELNLAHDLTGLTDPGLIALDSNGGPTPTHALLPDSPAIDAANPADCPVTDQRGEARDDLRCDIGAYELKYPDSPTIIRSVSSATATTFGPALIAIQRDAAIDPGVITVTKALTWQTKPANAIDVYWSITPTVDSGLNLTLTLCYTSTESNGLNVNTLRFWRFGVGGWSAVPGTPVTASVGDKLCATLNSVNELSVWTLAASQPTAVTVQNLTARSSVATTLLWLALITAAGGIVVIGRKRRWRV